MGQYDKKEERVNMGGGRKEENEIKKKIKK